MLDTPISIGLWFSLGKRRVAPVFSGGLRGDSREFFISKHTDLSLRLCLGTVPLILRSEIRSRACTLTHLHANLLFYILCGYARDEKPKSGDRLHLGKQERVFCFFSLILNLVPISTRALVILERNRAGASRGG